MTLKKAVLNFFKGIFVGIANIIPGVSGGTIAVVLNIFDELIESINNIFKNFKKYFLFLLPIILGTVVGIVGFSSLLEYCLDKHSFPTSMFFVGLVVGSLPLILKKASAKKFDYKNIALISVAFTVVVAVFLIKGGDTVETTRAINPGYMIWLFICGTVASAAMVIPGISGSFVMVMLGVYSTVLTSVSQLKNYLVNPSDTELLFSLLKVLLPLGLGVIAGIILISKLIELLFKKFRTETYYVIFGLILGSIFGIFNDPVTYSSGINVSVAVASVIFFALGTVLSLILGKR